MFCIGLPWWHNSKNSACRGDTGSIPGSGRFPGEGNGNPLQYSCLENPIDRWAWRATVHGVAKSQTWFYNCVHTHTHIHTHVLCKFCKSHLLKVMVIVIGAQLRSLRINVQSSRHTLDLSKILTQNGIRNPILDLSLHLGQSGVWTVPRKCWKSLQIFSIVTSIEMLINHWKISDCPASMSRLDP